MARCWTWRAVARRCTHGCLAVSVRESTRRPPNWRWPGGTLPAGWVVCASASALPLARHVIEPRGPFSLELGASSGFGPRDGEPGARLLRTALCVDGFASTSASSGASATAQSRWTSTQHTTASSRVLDRLAGGRPSVSGRR